MTTRPAEGADVEQMRRVATGRETVNRRILWRLLRTGANEIDSLRVRLEAARRDLERWLAERTVTSTGAQ